MRGRYFRQLIEHQPQQVGTARCVPQSLKMGHRILLRLCDVLLDSDTVARRCPRRASHTMIARARCEHATLAR